MAWLERTMLTDYAIGSNLVTLSLCFILCYLLTFLMIKEFRRRQKAKYIDQIPGPTTVPLFGNALEINVDPKEVFKLITGKFCSFDSTTMSRIWLGSQPYCLLYKAQSAEVILSSQKHIDKSDDYRFLHPWLGTGLLTATGRKWHSRRKMLTPTFHFKILEDFVEVFNQESFKLVRNLQRNADGKAFDIFQSITLCTLDIILETAMGRSINAQDNSESDYVKAIYKISAIVQQRQVRPWLHPTILFKLFGYAREHDRCLRILHGFSLETIRERKEEFRQCQNLKKTDMPDDEVEYIGKKRKRLAFLDLLLEYSGSNNELSDEDIREEVDTFMFEGHDTTAAAINWTVYLLGSYPKIQQEVHDELDAIFGDSDRPVTSADLKEMRLLDCCIKESLRLFPSVPMIGRELTEDVNIDGYRVPSGTTALIVTYRLHRDPDQFPDPEQFKPERFLPENSMHRHPYAYLPFSAGPRNCIGQRFALMEEKIVLANFFRKYRVESTIRREDLHILGELILRPENGNIVKLYQRS